MFGKMAPLPTQPRQRHSRVVATAHQSAVVIMREVEVADERISRIDRPTIMPFWARDRARRGVDVAATEISSLARRSGYIAAPIEDEL